MREKLHRLAELSFPEWLLLPQLVLQQIGGRGKAPVLNMSYLVDDLHLLNQFKSDIIIYVGPAQQNLRSRSHRAACS